MLSRQNEAQPHPRQRPPIGLRGARGRADWEEREDEVTPDPVGLINAVKAAFPGMQIRHIIAPGSRRECMCTVLHRLDRPWPCRYCAAACAAACAVVWCRSAVACAEARSPVQGWGDAVQDGDPAPAKLDAPSVVLAADCPGGAAAADLADVALPEVDVDRAQRRIANTSQHPIDTGAK